MDLDQKANPSRPWAGLLIEVHPNVKTMYLIVSKLLLLRMDATKSSGLTASYMAI